MQRASSVKTVYIIICCSNQKFVFPLPLSQKPVFVNYFSYLFRRKTDFRLSAWLDVFKPPVIHRWLFAWRMDTYIPSREVLVSRGNGVKGRVYWRTFTWLGQSKIVIFLSFWGCTESFIGKQRRGYEIERIQQMGMMPWEVHWVPQVDSKGFACWCSSFQLFQMEFWYNDPPNRWF